MDGQTDGQMNLHLSRSLLEENIMYEYNLNRFYGCTNSSLPNMLLTNHFFGTALKQDIGIIVPHQLFFGLKQMGVLKFPAYYKTQFQANILLLTASI